MKMENYTAATKYVNDLLTSYISNLVPVRVAKKDGFATATLGIPLSSPTLKSGSIRSSTRVKPWVLHF